MTTPDTPNVPAKAEARPQITTGGKVEAFIPTDLDQAWRLSEALAKTGADMLPKAYVGKPGAVFLAVVKGMELGLSPLAAIQNIAPVNGRATLWGDAIPGLLLRDGHRLEEVVDGDGEKMVATCTLVRSDGTRTTRTFSVDDAKKAGLWGKPGPWQGYPKRMLMMRARGYAARDGAADSLMGLSVAEEVRDNQGFDHARDITPDPATPAMRTRGGGGWSLPQNAVPAAPAAEPVAEVLEPEPAAEAPAQPAHRHSRHALAVSKIRAALTAALDPEDVDAAMAEHTAALAKIEADEPDTADDLRAMADERRGALEGV